MRDDRPYRAGPPDPTRLGWIESREGCITMLSRARHSEDTSRAVSPIVLSSVALFGFLGTAYPLTQALSVVLAAGVAATWPLASERVVIGPRGLVWRDRVLGARIRLALDRIAPRVVDRTHDRALWIGEGIDKRLLAAGDAGDVDALALALSAAIERARIR